MSRRRIVFVDHCAQPGGAEIALLRLVEELDAETVVILGEDGPLRDLLAASRAAVRVVAMDGRARTLPRARGYPVAAGPLAVASAARYSLVLAQHLRALSPDLVVANSLKSAVYGSVAARLAGRPVAWHQHVGLVPEFLPTPAIRLVRAAARLCDGVVANSRWTLQTCPHVRGPSTVIPPPLPSSTQRGVARRSGSALRVGVVGRIAPWKGQDVFLRAFAAAFPRADDRALIVGAPLFGEVDYERHLRGLVSDLGLTGRVEFRGYQADVGAELSNLDVLVHSSVIPEPFGMVVAEGMQAGLPVVAANAGGPREIISSGHNGLLYPTGNVEALAGHLRALALDPQLRRRLGLRACVAAGAFAVERIAPRMLAFYEHVLEVRRLRRRLPASAGRTTPPRRRQHVGG